MVLIGIGAGMLVGAVSFAVWGMEQGHRAQGTGHRGDAVQVAVDQRATHAAATSTDAQMKQSGAVSVVQAIPASATTTRDSGQLSMMFLGDVMLDRLVRSRMSATTTKNFPFNRVIEAGLFKGRDLIVANLEGPVTKTRRPPEKSIDFAFDPSVVPLLKNIGIDAVSQANNHALDQGRAGADDSRSFLLKQGIAVFGDQVRDDAASAMTIIERQGQKIALVGFNDSDRPVNREAAAATITEAKSQADRVIVMMHWGAEYQAKPNTRQTDLAHWLIDQGVDAVIGGHPHWMESVEVYNHHVIAYSLGNFVFDQDWSTETQYGLAVGLAFDVAGSSLSLYPIRITKSQPIPLSGSDRFARLSRLADISDPGLSDAIKAGMIQVDW
jgi:poly-gamma-glutamate synthesis protein (capsule biosynthesis protein)